jgi:hypothetical protein
MAVMPVELDKLQDRDARSDEHESADSLRAALRWLYGDARLTRVRFRLPRPADADVRDVRDARAATGQGSG